MKIFPAIDIKDKKCVRLVKGDFDNKTEYEIFTRTGLLIKENTESEINLPLFFYTNKFLL